MIHFNELKLDAASKHLIIDVEVLDEPYFEDVYIDSISIDNQYTYVSNRPSSTPVYSYSVSDNQKSLRLELSSFDLYLDGLLFIYVKTKGNPTMDVPCGMDNTITMGTIINMYPFYQRAMDYIKELSKDCSVPQNFTDYILKLKALELSIKTGNYPIAIDYYKKFFSDCAEPHINIGGCNCGNK